MEPNESVDPLSESFLEQSILSAYYQDIGEVNLLTSEEEIQYSKIIQNTFRAMIDSILNEHMKTGRFASLVSKIAFWQKQNEVLRPKQCMINEINQDVKTIALQHPQCEKFHEKIVGYCKEIKSAKDVLVKNNLCLVTSVAKRYLQRNISLSDLIQEGNIGLMRAAIRFNGSRGARFSSYAIWWIRQAITSAIGGQTKTIRLPSHFRGQCNSYFRSFRELNSELGRKPNLQEMSRATKIPMEKILFILEIAQETVSLETPVHENGNTLLHLLEDENGRSPYQRMVNRELLDKLKKCFSSLTSRQREILYLRFGLEGQGELTLQEVADKLKLSRERVRQAELRAIYNIRRSDHVAEIQNY